MIERTPTFVCSRRVRVIVVDDGSTDGTGEIAEALGATVVRHDEGRGLGAAVRTGLRLASAIGVDAVAFCDADGEYAPEELEIVVGPILEGRADYVVGSRFAGRIERMLLRRRLGNIVLTKILALLTGVRITDGQSGYRALSRRAAAAAEIAHDYNYAQVLTVEMLAKGFGYTEVPITYSFRTAGRSFVRPITYLRKVVPALSAELIRHGIRRHRCDLVGSHVAE